MAASPTGTDTVNPKMPSLGHERRFYSAQAAFGRFGIRLFDPVLMQRPHWHGHIEANFAVNTALTYDVDGQVVHVPANRLVLFWAGMPHQLIDFRPTHAADQAKLCNIYIPLDAFLYMNHIAPLHMALLGGGVVALPEALCDAGAVRGWYRDYRTGDFARSELVKAELNTLLRRAALDGVSYLRAPQGATDSGRTLTIAHMRHVTAMVRHVLENLEKPLRNADITAVTGLHENYALSLFSRVMRVPLKQFVIRMRLMRARALLVESALPISVVAAGSGFSSVSQFYAQFKAGYGIAPAEVRAQFLRMDMG